MEPTPSLPVSDNVIVGLGARSAGGLNALQVTMSARALKFVPRESYLIDRRGEPISMGRLRSIGDQLIGIDRFLALGAPALTQATFTWLHAEEVRTQARPRIPVIVALPAETRPGFDSRLKQHFLPALEQRSRVLIDPALSSLVFQCRGGGVVAFERALGLLREGRTDAVAVGGVDSYFDPDVLEWLDAEMRLHSLDAENGFIPGEGAAFVLLASRRRASSVRSYGQVIAAASTLEPNPYGSPEPCIGQALSDVIKRAAQPVGENARRIPWALTDVANERHRVEEWGLARSRTFAAFTPDAVHDQPLLKTGDVGAASAAMLLSMAAVRWDAGAGRGDCALIATHSDGAERGALLASPSAA